MHVIQSQSYYESQEQSSSGWHESKNDYVPVIINILQMIYRCFKDLDESFTDISLKKTKKSERVENILLGAIVPISKRDIVEKVPDISVKTIELVLSKILSGLNPDGYPSMRQDAVAKRYSEVELFAGTVLKLAVKHGIDTPANKRYYEDIKKVESDY